IVNLYSIKEEDFTVSYPYISFINKETDFSCVQFLLIFSNSTRIRSTVDLVKESGTWVIKNFKVVEQQKKQKKFINKRDYINSKPKILLGYRDFSGCNTLALYKSIPSYINDVFEIELVKGATNEFTQKALDSDIIVTTNMEYSPESNGNKEKIVIDTWHGLPLKTMFYSDPHYFDKNKIEPYWKEVDYLTSYSDFYSKTINEAIKVDPENFVITGSPRNDFLFNNKDKNRELLLKLLGKEDNGQRLIFYIPTFRQTDVQKNDISHNIFGFEDFNLNALDNFLESNNYELIVKLHPLYKKNLSPNLFSNSRINMYPEMEANKQFIDLYEFLSAT